MPPKEGQPKRLTVEERLVRRYMTRVERGDDVIVSRIFSTLLIDGVSKPSIDHVRQFVRVLKEEHARGEK